MKHLNSSQAIVRFVCLSLAIFVLPFSIFGQKTTAKKKPLATKKATTPNVLVKIDTAAINVTKPIAALGSDQFADIILKFLVAGNPPENDISEKLAIDDRTTAANPQFYEGASLSKTLTVKIPKAKFQGIGGFDTVKLPVRIIYKKATNEKGVAYIGVVGQDGEFTKLSFNSTSKSNRTVELLDSTTKVQLDTFQKGKKIEPSVKLYFMLKKAAGTDTTVQIIPDNDIENVALSDDGRIKPYSVAIESSDWNSKKDTIVTKTINVFVKPLVPIESTKDLLLKINGKGAAGHIVELIPAKTIAKNTLTNPVPFENAQLLSNKLSITHYFNGALNTIDTVHVRVQLRGNYDKYANQLDFVIFDIDSVPSKHFKILKTPITLTQNDWDTAKSKHLGILTIPLYVRTIGLNDSTNNIHYINVVLKGQKQSVGAAQSIKVVSKERPFWAEIGTNFDLLDKIKTNNLYVGVLGYLRDITGVNKAKNNLSFTGGVYEAQSVTLGSSAASGFNYRNGSSTIADTNFKTKPYQYLTDTGRIKATTVIKSIGLFFSPQIRLTCTPTEENGLHLYFSVYTEMLWQRVTTTLDYTQTAKTNTTHTAALDSLVQNVPFKEGQFDLDYRSHYLGFGLPIFIKESGFTMYINGVYGLTSQRFVFIDNSSGLNTNQYNPTVQNINPAYTNSTNGIGLLNFAQPKSRWNSFYLIQYRLTESRYGITFSGEVRGLTLNGSKPVITLALSKKFDLSALVKPLVAPY